MFIAPRRTVRSAELLVFEVAAPDGTARVRVSDPLGGGYWVSSSGDDLTPRAVPPP